MKKEYIAIWISLIIIIMGCSENSKQTKELHLFFYPSFDAPIEFKIEFNATSTTLTSKILSERNHNIVTDSLTQELNPSLVRKFNKDFLNIDFENHKSKQRQILDGIGVGFKKINTNRDTFQFSCPSPYRSDYEIEYIILDAFFDLAEKSLAKEKLYIEKIERVKDYLSYGFPVKLVNKNPLEYKVWGSLTAYDEKELEDFLVSLPKDQPIILDFSNFPGMGTMFYPLFKRINDQKKIYYYTAGKNIWDLPEIGNCIIIKSRSKIDSLVQ